MPDTGQGLKRPDSFNLINDVVEARGISAARIKVRLGTKKMKPCDSNGNAGLHIGRQVEQVPAYKNEVYGAILTAFRP
jgi:hypothetical protein